VTIPTIPFELHQQLKQTFPYAVILREFEGARVEQKISRKTNWRAFWSHQNLKQKFTRVVSEIRNKTPIPSMRDDFWYYLSTYIFSNG